MNMNENFVSVEKLSRELRLETVYLPDGDAKITTADVNRPGLQITGFFDYFESERLQIFGMVENTYLAEMDSAIRAERFEKLFSTKFPAAILTRGADLLPEMLTAAQKYKVPILRTEEGSSRFMSALIAFLNVELAPQITRHGVLVEVYGEGMLILGESGVGKSETAVELLKRGHRLVADDAVEIKRVSAKALVGTSPEIIRHFIEIRGIGIVDVQKIFGMGAVKQTEKIDMVIHLETWQDGKAYDRLGLVSEYTNILGLDVPSLTVPVKPGRNLAIIFEVAAMNNRQKKMGYNAAEELNSRILYQMNKTLEAEGAD